MSHQATTWVMEFSESRLADRLVLGAIAHRVSNDNGEAFPSVETIAREANVSESSVHASLKRLQKLGELEVKVGASEYSTNVYRMPKFMAWMEALHLPRSGGRGGTKSVPRSGCRGSNPDGSGVQSLGTRGTGSAPEPSGTIIEPSGAAPDRPSQDTRSKPVSTADDERQFTQQLKELAKQEDLPSNGRPSEPLRAELYDGIFRRKISNAFFDLRLRPSAEQLQGCVHDAVTSLVTNRTGKLMVLRAEDIESRTIAKLRSAWATLQAVQDFSRRSVLVTSAIARAAADAAAELLEALPRHSALCNSDSTFSPGLEPQKAANLC